MTYFDHNRPQEPYQPTFPPPDKGDIAIPVDEDDDRIYTEEDYAIAPDGDAFLPDEEELPPPFSYAGSYDTVSGVLLDDEEDNLDERALAESILDEDPLADELLTDEERLELRRSTWQLLAGLGDFAGVILGTAAILILVALLVSLMNWLVSDISQTFTLWQIRL